MEQAKYDVFISYSRHDYIDEHENVILGNVITAIKEVLRHNDISYWMDEEGNLTGKKFAHIIASKIRESMVFLFVCCRNSVASRWVDRELSVADTLDKHIIPFICDDSYMDDKVIMFTSSLDRVEYYRNPQKEMEKLISTIKKDKAELKMKILEDEKIRQQKLKEAEEKERIERVRKEIEKLVTSYKIHTVQQESIIQQLYSKNKAIGREYKQCPVCDNAVYLSNAFCENCGWQFPPLYALDGKENPAYDTKQLTLARANWQMIGKTAWLKSEEGKRLEEKKREDEVKRNAEEKIVKEKSNHRKTKELKYDWEFSEILVKSKKVSSVFERDNIEESIDVLKFQEILNNEYGIHLGYEKITSFRTIGNLKNYILKRVKEDYLWKGDIK